MEVLFNSAGMAAIPVAEIYGFPRKGAFLGHVGDFVPMQICPGGIHHYQQVNLTLPQQEGRTWAVMETPNHSCPGASWFVGWMLPVVVQVW